MNATMTAGAERKYPNLQLLQGGNSGPARIIIRGRRRGRRTKTAAEIVLQRWVREEFNALGSPRPSEAIQKICQDEQFPLNVFGRRMVEMHAAGCTHGQARRIWARVGHWIDRLWEQPLDVEDVVRETVFFQGPVGPLGPRRCA